MLTKKEIIAILVSTIIIAFSINLMTSISSFLSTLLAIFAVILVNLIAKKITGFNFDVEIETTLWEIKRYGFKAHHRLKKALPVGAFLPILSKLILFPINNFVWMASLVFDVKAKTYRAAKRHGLYKFSEMTEDHLGYIAAAGIGTNLAFGIIGYLIGFPLFAKLNIYYAFFNMIPISNLDGNKIFFGNIILWIFLAIITLIGLGYALLLV
ncbi:hypothetical protein KAI04_01805 [Candidatus Pacearchaeota archaeon]|nr:hypothetical protein [Candidatus Pacearchaeota archaeon]